jgi:hypothetical protein
LGKNLRAVPAVRDRPLPSIAVADALLGDQTSVKPQSLFVSASQKLRESQSCDLGRDGAEVSIPAVVVQCYNRAAAINDASGITCRFGCQ